MVKGAAEELRSNIEHPLMALHTHDGPHARRGKHLAQPPRVARRDKHAPNAPPVSACRQYLPERGPVQRMRAPLPVLEYERVAVTLVHHAVGRNVEHRGSAVQRALQIRDGAARKRHVHSAADVAQRVTQHFLLGGPVQRLKHSRLAAPGAIAAPATHQGRRVQDRHHGPLAAARIPPSWSWRRARRFSGQGWRARSTAGRHSCSICPYSRS